jgi:CheY-like chemotaxis protein
MRNGHEHLAPGGAKGSEDGGLLRADWSQRARILVVDDEPLLCQTLGFMLQENYEVVIAPNGEAAVESLEQHPEFDLVLCDLDMPGMNGPSLHQHMKERHPRLLSRFVLMTGGACSPWAEDFLATYSGAQLEKPFTVADVDAVVAALGRVAALS